MISLIIKLFYVVIAKVRNTDYGYIQVTIEDAYKFIVDNIANPNYIVIDIRTPAEYRQGHVKNAINIDFYADDFEMTLSRYSRKKKYLVYCKHGTRTKGSLHIFNSLGFENVFYYNGDLAANMRLSEK